MKQTAELWASLMRDALGYQRYAAAGGDGAIPISQSGAQQPRIGHRHPSD